MKKTRTKAGKVLMHKVGEDLEPLGAMACDYGKPITLFNVSLCFRFSNQFPSVNRAARQRGTRSNAQAPQDFSNPKPTQMKTLRFTGLLITLFTATALLQAGGTEVLLDEHFNYPSEITHSYPPSAGDHYQRFHSVFSAWANKGGQIAVTYGNGFGIGKSGGLSAEIKKPAEEGGYLSVSAENLRLSVTSPDLIGSCLRSMQVEFSANIPADHELNLFLVPAAVPEELKARAFASRLILGKLTGNGEYKSYSLKCGDFMLADSDPFLRYLQDCLSAGMKEVVFNVVWHIHGGGEWKEGDGFLLDEVKVTLIHAK